MKSSRPVKVKVAILGAGPAGLAAAQALSSQQTVVLDAGSPLARRNQGIAEDLVAGVGGAGLFSDGKFSYWPSATNLWGLREDLVKSSFEWFRREMEAQEVPVFDYSSTGSLEDNGISLRKHYPSVYATPDQRHRIIAKLAGKVQCLVTNTPISNVSWTEDGWRVDGTEKSWLAQNLVLATGRYATSLMPLSAPGLTVSPRRIEVGVRIEQDRGQFFLNDEISLDPKYVWRDDSQSLEWRTFCCCRDGRVEETRLMGILSVSGRADCPPTGRSNVGFNLRILDPSAIRNLWPSLLLRCSANESALRTSLADFMASSEPSRTLATLFGPAISNMRRDGLKKLLEQFPYSQLDNAEIVGPAMEGVGQYIWHDNSLRSSRKDLWVAGDAAGTFRGLTAAMVSGYVAGLAIAEVL